MPEPSILLAISRLDRLLGARDFERSDGLRQGGALALGDEQVNMLRHHDKTLNPKTVLDPGVLQRLDYDVSGFTRVQLGQTSIAAKGDEVRLSGTVKTPKSLGHRVPNAPRFWARWGG